jgi:MFS family permease
MTSVANFMIAPVLAIWLSSEGLSLTQVGAIVTVVIVAQQGLTLPAGAAADALGPHQIIHVALLLRVVGYGLFAAVEGLAGLLLAASLVGAGGALFQPSSKAIMAAGATEHRIAALALRSLALNVGAAIGPLIGALMVAQLRPAFAGAAATYLLFLLCFRGFGRRAVTRHHSASLRGQLATVLRDRRALHLLACTTAFWALYSQFTLTVPVFAERSTGAAGAMGVAFAVSAVVVIGTEYPAVMVLARRVPTRTVMTLGMTVLATAFAVLAAIPGWLGLLTFVVLFSLAEVLVVAFADLVATDIAPAGHVGTYLGLVSSAWAVGALAGNSTGTWLLASTSPEVLWLCCAGCAVLGGIACSRGRYARAPIGGQVQGVA